MIKVFIIDDSILIRNLIKKILKKNHSIEIIGEAPNPVDAMQEFKNVGLPDVFILDIEMPKMDGLSFLKKLKEERPIPAIVFSSVVEKGSQKAIEALRLGACDILLKPKDMNELNSHEIYEEFSDKIKAAANSKNIDDIVINPAGCNGNTRGKSDKIIAMGASTGGVQTLESILTNLAAGHPPILITQHMPAGFTASFAKRLNKECPNSVVVEAKNGDELRSGMVFIAPGDIHLEVQKDALGYKTVLKDYPKVSNHKPSVDVLFKSMAKEVKQQGVAFLLTGMGRDGAMGLKKIKESGGTTYAQDEQSSIVYGMPRAAVEMDAVCKQLSINDIIDTINDIK